MLSRALHSSILLLIIVTLLSACAPRTELPVTETSAQQPAPTDDIPVTSPPTDTVLPPVAPFTSTPEPGEPIDPDKNTLVVIEGVVRISQDNGNSWTATGTGRHLVAGDQIQLSGDGLALIYLFNGAVVRLEGPSDFQLMLAETDNDSGATKIIARLWDGFALFDTNPLPTPDSMFQLYVMTSFINVEYDEETAALGTSIDLDPDLSIIAGGLLDEQSEMLYHFRGPASLYVLDWEEDEYIAVEYQGKDETVTSLDIGFLDDFILEANMEGFTDIAGLLMHQYKLSGDLRSSGAVGYYIDEIEELDSGEIIYFFEMDVAAENTSSNLRMSYFNPPNQVFKLSTLIQSNPTSTPDTQTKPTYLGRVKYRTSPALLYAARNPQATTTEVKILYGQKAGFGCNPLSGYGCPAPAGCDQGTGDRCTLSTGCNVVTKEGCKSTTVTCNKYGKYRDGALIGTSLVCPASKQPGCNPNIPRDCDKFYDPDAWKKFEEQDDDDDVDWCWCKAKVPPGWPPPPPWMDMYYRCWCSDPGAVPIKP